MNFFGRAALMRSSALVSDQRAGALWVWGNQNGGNLGNGVNSSSIVSSPIQIGSDEWVSQALFGSSSGRNIRSMGVKKDGTLWMWGELASGVWPFGTYLFPTQFGTDSDWKAVYGTGLQDYGMALKKDGSLWRWGIGRAGNLSVSSPVQVGSDLDWSKVSVGGGHTLALKTDGTLWVWGSNDQGWLGLGDYTLRSSPVQLGTNTWKSIAAGHQNSFGVRSDGSLWGWGRTYYNMLPPLSSNNSIQKSSPIQVGDAALTNWRSVYTSAIRRLALAINEDGNLFTWGQNGQLGLGGSGFNRHLSPKQMGAKTWRSLGTNWGAVAAVDSDGALFNWGEAGNGFLVGNVATSTPTQVGVETTWKGVFPNRAIKGS